MYYLFHCPDFDTPAYQLAYSTDNRLFLANWCNSLTEAINDTCTSDTSLPTPEARIQRFQTSHENTKSIHLIAQAPTPADFYNLYPELFL